MLDKKLGEDFLFYLKNINSELNEYPPPLKKI